MSGVDWDSLASVCEANHDLYAASVTGDETMARDAIKRGADLCHVVKWLDDVESIKFFLISYLPQMPLRQLLLLCTVFSYTG